MVLKGKATNKPLIDPKEVQEIPVHASEREAVIRSFGPVIRTIAHRMAFRLPAYLDADDLISVGIIGLMDAMTKYDPTREAKFKTYAEFRIRGAMLDEIRSMDWIPRSVHDRISLLQKTHRELMNRLGHPPTDQEVADALKLSVNELDEFVLQARGALMISIEDLGVNDFGGQKILRMLADTKHPDPLSMVVAENVREMLGRAIEQLPEKQRLVLTLYYYEELTMREIGEILHVTESRICQIHTKAVIRLKARLQSLV